MKSFIKIIILSSLAFALPMVSLAVGITFDSTGNQFLKGEDFVIVVEADTGEDSINAIEGEIFFPEGIVEIKEIQDGNTMVNFWLERPKQIEGNIVRFSGFTPGGFVGGDNVLFSVVLKADKVGQGIISAQNIVSLRNDGVGTKAPSSSKSLPIIVSEDSSIVSGGVDVVDTELPESFTPIISQSPEIFDGKYFIVFATQDKISGIDYYRIREGDFGIFYKVSSPYLLKDQTLSKNIHIKAIDKAGNERLEILTATNGENRYHNYNIFVILLLVFIIFLGKKIWTRYIK